MNRLTIDNAQVVLSLAAFTASLALCACATASDRAEINEPYEVSQVLSQCGAPGRCGQPLRCEGRRLAVIGVIDPINVYDRTHYPSLAYEKFTLVDKRSSHTIEVWAAPSKNEAMFGVLEPYHGQSVLVSALGRAVGVDLPTSTRCGRTIKIEINSAIDLTVKQAD